MAAFFAACAQNRNEIILIAHHFMRYTPAIREGCNRFTWVRKVKKPFSSKPWYFEMRIDEDLKAANRTAWPGFWEIKRTRFKKEIAECYNCHFFCKLGKDPEYEPWVTDLREPQKNTPLRLKLSELINKPDEDEDIIKPYVTPESENTKNLVIKYLEGVREGFRSRFKKTDKAFMYGDIVFYTWLAALIFSSGMFVINLCLLVA